MIYLDTSVLGALFFREPAAGERAAALAAFHRFVADTLTLVELDPGDFRTAAVLLDAPDLTLRAGDALHLSIARRLRASLFTLDRRQADAARHYGMTLFA